jgi:hypothetical protein
MTAKVAAVLVGIGCLAGVLLTSGPALPANEAETAELLVRLLQAGRSVISNHQELINDPSKANKGFTPDYLAEKMVEKYRETTKIDLNKPGSTPHYRLLMMLVESGKEVIAEAQPIINKQGIGFKGLIPAAWGRKTGERFAQKTGIKLKLTAMDYRFPGNKPDEFESEILRLFSDPNYPKGKEYSRMVMVNGQPAFRLMAPEYIGPTCLKCHGSFQPNNPG